jgi:hypothetical protein
MRPGNTTTLASSCNTVKRKGKDGRVRFDAMGKRCAPVPAGTMWMVWTGAIGLRWFRICCNFGNCSGACAVKVDRFRIGRVEQARMGCIVLSIEVGARSAGLLFRVARHIRVHGREQHRVHERDSVHGGKSFPMAYFINASIVCHDRLVRPRSSARDPRH